LAREAPISQHIQRRQHGYRHTGYHALYSNERYENTAIGYQALYLNTAGLSNTATASGNAALFSNTTGGLNTANGSYALNNNTTGFYNTASGSGALISNTTGLGNTAVGTEALGNSSTGNWLTCIGAYCDIGFTMGLSNATVIGAHAMIRASNALVLGGREARAVMP
jgi:hypothetical protein